MADLNILRGIFSDTTEEYVTPTGATIGDSINIKLRVVHNSVKKAELVSKDCRVEMTLSRQGKNINGFDYLECSYTLKEKILSYYFHITLEDEECIYDFRGIEKEPKWEFAFRIIPGFTVPDWAKGGVFYQIYTDRFYNGDKSNDVVSGEYKYIDSLVEKKGWNEDIETGLKEFYGGDLKGVMDKMDYLADLGVEVIYLNPIFVSPSNHKYDTADYDYVDPHFGVILKDGGDILSSATEGNDKATKFITRVATKENLEASNELFARLVEKAHERGMKVILDGVFNHCGSFNKWMDAERIYENADGYEKGAYVSKDSPYRDYFYFKENSDEYEGWWDYNTLPKLNYSNKELYDYILKVAAKWVSEPYCADGWRLDVAADLGRDEETNHKFWKDFRNAVKTANPNAIILAEHYGNPIEWLDGTQWDTVMNYDAFMEPVSWFLTGMEKHNDSLQPELINDQNTFWKSMRECGAKFTNDGLLSAMNELSNHDHSRFITRTTGIAGRVFELGKEAASENANKAVFMEAVVMQMTWQGAPTIYYGDEAGLAGFTDPDNRRVYPWGNEDAELLRFHKDIIKIHKENEELKTGSLIPLPTPMGTIAYGRKKDNNITLTIVNNMDVAMEYKLPVWILGEGQNIAFDTLLKTAGGKHTPGGKRQRASKGVLEIILEPKSAIVLKYIKRKKLSDVPFLRRK